MHNEIDMAESQEIPQGGVITVGSRTGQLVHFDEMHEITNWHREEMRYQALGHHYEDFYRFYLGEFPGAYPWPRVRMSDGVRTFFEQSRPNPVEIPWEEAIHKIYSSKDVSASQMYDWDRKKIVSVVAEREKREKGQGFSSISLEPKMSLQFLFKAEIDKEANRIVFTPEIVSQTGTHYGPHGAEELQAAIAKTFALETVNVTFPEQIRVEHLIGYEAHPSKKEASAYGPKWELSEVPIARVSLVSDPTAEEVDAKKKTELSRDQQEKQAKPKQRGFLRKILARKRE
ncbi:hypothetical protein HY008_03080 [Candidatus Woesebacteria bacterium]|nr:hypothetical protein [Candidatus Woesebacteria bacterium]